jgi:hypothetical protein
MDWKSHATRRFFGLSGLLVTGLFAGVLPGCKKEEEPTTVVKLPPGIVSLQEEIGKGKTQLQTTIASLEAVVASAGSDAKSKSSEFAKNMAALDAQAAAIKAKADDMRARGTAYFKAWEDQLATVATPSIKEAAEKRRDQLTKNYEGVTVAFEAARDASKPLISDLKDVQKMLDTDLSADSVKALADPVARIKADGKTLGEKLDQAIQALNKVGAIYSGQS